MTLITKFISLITICTLVIFTLFVKIEGQSVTAVSVSNLIGKVDVMIAGSGTWQPARGNMFLLQNKSGYTKVKYLYLFHK